VKFGRTPCPYSRRGLVLKALLCTSFVAFAFAALPSLAEAVVIAPYVVGTSATPTSNGAKLTATVYPYGSDTHYYFEYGTTNTYGTDMPSPPGVDLGAAAYPASTSVEQTISGLTSGMTYHYRIVASNGVGAATGATGDLTFTTLSNATPPAVTVNEATPITGGFKLSGTVNPNGAETHYRFEYGVSTSYGASSPSPEGQLATGTSAVGVSTELKSLLPNTTYHFRLVAKNSAGSGTPSEDKEFTTPKSEPAVPAAEAIEPIETANGYKLQGNINPNGLKTGYHFEFGTTTEYGTNIPESNVNIGEGEATVPVFQEIGLNKLTPNTTYHYRIVAENSKGPGMSKDEQFTTRPEPPAVAATPFTKTAEGYVINGTVDPHGAATTYYFEFGTTTAYGTSLPTPEAIAGSGNAPVAVFVVVGGLPPGVPYHYRLVAKNRGGTTISEDQAFTTPSEVVEPPLPPPPLPPPSNKFSVGSVSAKGTTAALQISVPGPGTVSASGKDLKPSSTIATGPGTINLKLKLTSAGTKALKKAKGHKLKLKATITFQPAGGSAASTSRNLMFKQSGGK
jgi:trimeric autotransporter adhesin